MFRFMRYLRLLLIAIVLVMNVTPALAAKKTANAHLEEVDTSKSYALPYGLVVLGVALGVMLVARPSTRGDQPKRRKNEDDELD